MAEKDDDLEEMPVSKGDDPNFTKTATVESHGIEKSPRTPRNKSSSGEKAKGKGSNKSLSDRKERRRFSRERKENIIINPHYSRCKRSKVASVEETSDLQVEINAQGIKSNKSEISWQNYGGRKQIHILNKTESIHAVKIRCSDNALFQITPPMTSIQPFETVNIRIRRFKAPIKPDRINILVTPQVEESPDILAYFTPCAPAGKPCLKFDKVKLIFNKVGGDQRLRVTNNLPNRIGIKVQCTDNFLYKSVEIIDTAKNFTANMKSRSVHDTPQAGCQHIDQASTLMAKKDYGLEDESVVQVEKRIVDDLPDYFDKKGLKITEVYIPVTCT